MTKKSFGYALEILFLIFKKIISVAKVLSVHR